MSKTFVFVFYYYYYFSFFSSSIFFLSVDLLLLLLFLFSPSTNPLDRDDTPTLSIGTFQDSIKFHSYLGGEISERMLDLNFIETDGWSGPIRSGRSYSLVTKKMTHYEERATFISLRSISYIDISPYPFCASFFISIWLPLTSSSSSFFYVRQLFYRSLRIP